MSIADELEKLANLQDKGVLTEEEFRLQKAKIIGKHRLPILEKVGEKDSLEIGTKENQETVGKKKIDAFFIGLIILLSLGYGGWKLVGEPEGKNMSQSENEQTPTHSEQETNVTKKYEAPPPPKEKKFIATFICDMAGNIMPVYICFLSDGEIVLIDSFGQKSYGVRDLMGMQAFDVDLKSPFSITAQRGGQGENSRMNLVLKIVDADTGNNVYTGNAANAYGVISIKDP